MAKSDFKLLRCQIDLDHLIEELESLSRRDKAKVVSLLKQIIIHLLFLQFWTEEIQDTANCELTSYTFGRTPFAPTINYVFYKVANCCNQHHWEAEVIAFKDQLNRLLTTNLLNYLDSELEIVYQNAVKIVAKKMKTTLYQFPEQCPYTIEQLLDEVK